MKDKNTNKEIKKDTNTVKNKVKIKKQKKIRINKTTMITLCVLSTLFIILTILIYTKKINFIDEAVTSFILSIRSKKLTNIMSIITNISSAYSLIVLTILLFVALKDKKNGLIITLNLILSFLTGQLLKIILRRPRPVDINIVNTIGYSYPSGHSMVSMAYFGLFIYLISKKVKNKTHRIFLITINSILIFLIGFSRIYLGVHYFSDVIGGFILAIIFLILFINFVIPLFKKVDKK